MKNKIILGMAALLVLTSLTGCKKEDKKPDSSQSEVVHVESVAVSPARAAIYLNDENPSIQLEAYVLPETASDKTVTWSSSDDTVATVSNTGLVTGLKQGNVTITAKSNDGEKVGTSTISVKVDRTQDATIDQLNKPSFYSRWERNTTTLDPVANISTTADPDRTTYYQNEQGGRDVYKVGNQNEFRAQVTGKVTDDDGVDTTVTSPFTKVKVELFDESDSSYDEIDEGELANHVALSPNNSSYKFTEAAAGNRYKITVSVDESMYAHVSEECSDVVMEVEVFDGVNVYSLEELSVFDNVQNDIWGPIKAAKGLDQIQAKGIALHNSFVFENSDVPAAFKYSEAQIDEYISKYPTDFNNWVAAKTANRPSGSTEVFGKDTLVDSLVDWSTLFLRKTNTTDEEFRFEGNYFTIDIHKVKQIYAFYSSINEGNVYDRYQPEGLIGCNGSHGQIFGINTDIRDVGGAEIKFKNFTIIGNGERSDNDNYLGGLITFKTKSSDVLFQNILSSKTFITFLTECHDPNNDNETVTVFDRCKNFDSYNSLLYIYGTDHNLITNSFMVGAGGAIALLNDVNACNREAYQANPKVDCYNVFFENLLTGEEPWFVSHAAQPIVSNIKAFGNTQAWLGRNAAAHGNHMNIAVESNGKQFIDMIAIDVDGEDPLNVDLYGKGRMMEGKFNIYNDAAMTQLAAAMDLSKLKLNGLDDVMGIMAAYQQGNRLPLYRAAGFLNKAQTVAIETDTGVTAMLADANGMNGTILGIDEYGSDSPLAPYRQAIPGFDGHYITPYPFYQFDGETGAYQGEVAYNLGKGNEMTALANAKYMAFYMNPQAPGVNAVTGEIEHYYEFVGAFLKLHPMSDN